VGEKMRRKLLIVILGALALYVLRCTAGPGGPDLPDPYMPILYVSKTVLDFGETEDTLSFDIKNCGEGVLHWEVCPQSTCIACCSGPGCTPVCTTISGSTTTETDEVTVTISRNDKPGPYEHYIDVSCTDNGDIETVTVNFVILEPTLRAFGQVTDDQTGYLDDVRVVLEISGEDDRETYTYTDPVLDRYGYFEFLDVPARIQRILGYKDGYEDYILDKIIQQPGTDWDLSFQMTAQGG
jgi:hypothetical protein